MAQQNIPQPTSLVTHPTTAAQPAAPPVAVAATAPQPLAMAPFTVFVVDNTVQGGIPLTVISANIRVTRSGAMPTRGSVELRSVLAGNEQMSLMTLASKPGPYTLMIRYTGPDGIVIREDSIVIAEGSQAEYTGPEASKNGDSWEFIETLVIHAA